MDHQFQFESSTGYCEAAAWLVRVYLLLWQTVEVAEQ